MAQQETTKKLNITITASTVDANKALDTTRNAVNKVGAELKDITSTFDVVTQRFTHNATVIGKDMEKLRNLSVSLLSRLGDGESDGNFKVTQTLLKEKLESYRKANAEQLKDLQNTLTLEQSIRVNGANSAKTLAIKTAQEEVRILEDLAAKRRRIEEAIARGRSIQGTGGRFVSAAEASQQAQQAAQIRLTENRQLLEDYNNRSNAFDTMLRTQERNLRAGLAQQHSDYVHGADSVQSLRLRAAHNLETIERTHQAAIQSIRERRVSGNISSDEAARRVTAAQTSYASAVTRANQELHAQEQHLARIAERHHSIFLRVGMINASYMVWHTLQTAVLDGFRGIPKVGIELESSIASLTATAGGTAGAASMLAMLDKEAQRTGVSVGALRESFRGFQASTSLANETIGSTWHMFSNLNTVITGLHLPAEKATGIFNAMSQIFNKTKVQSEELVKQLGNLIPGAFASFYAANSVNTVLNGQKGVFKSSADLIAQMKKGVVFAHDTVERFTQFLADRFAPAFAQASQGLNAAIGRMDTSFTHLGESIYKLNTGFLKDTVVGITNLTNALTKDIEGANLFSYALKNVGAVLAGLVTVSLIQATKNLKLFSTALLATPLGRFAAAVGSLVTVGLAIKALADRAAEGEAKIASFYERINQKPKDNTEITLQMRIDLDPVVIQDKAALAEAEKKKAELEKKLTLVPKFGTMYDEQKKELQRSILAVETTIDVIKADLVKANKDAVIKLKFEDTQALIDLNEAMSKMHIQYLKAVGKAGEAAGLTFDSINSTDLAKATKQIDELGKQEAKLVELSKSADAGVAGDAMEKLLALSNARKFLDEAQVVRAKEVSDGIGNTNTVGANREIQLDKTKYKTLEKQQKEHYQTQLALLTAQQDALEYKQGLPSKAIAAEDFFNKQIDIIAQKELLALRNKEAQLTNIFNLRKEDLATQDKQAINSGKEVGNLQKALDIIQQIESDGNPGAVSPVGALGLRQVMPSTLANPGFGVQGIDVPANILAIEKVGRATKALTDKQISTLREYALANTEVFANFGKSYYTALVKYFKGDLVKAAAAYNSGAGNEEKGIRPKETKDYVDKFTAAMNGTDLKLVTTELGLQADETSVIENTNQNIVSLATERLNRERELEKALIERHNLEQDLNIQVLEAKNQLVDAAQARFTKEQQNNILQFQSVRTSKYATEEEKKQAEITLSNIKVLEEKNRLTAEQAALMQKLSQEQQAYSLSQAVIQKDESAYRITSFEALYKQQRLAKEALPTFESNIPNLTNNINDLVGKGVITQTEGNNQIASLQAQLLDLKNTAEGVEIFFKQNLADSFTSAFTDFTSGSKSAKDALADFATAFLQTIQKIIVEQLALFAVEKMIATAKAAWGASSLFFASGGSIPSNPSAKAQGLANGGNVLQFPYGAVKGEGTSTSDSIAAMLRVGDYVVKASEARRVNLSNGEFVIPKEIASKIAKASKEGGNFANGGMVGTATNVTDLSDFSDRQNRNSSVKSQQVNTIHVTVNHTGKESADELGNKVGAAVMQAIAKQEASRQIYMYDKGKSNLKKRAI